MTDVQFTHRIPVDLIDHTGDDFSVVHAARVSTKGVATTDDSVEWSEARGLINFLMRNRHGTPFEHASMTFFVKAPIFVFREFHRHRIGWSYNEESGRYKQLDPLFYIPAPDRNLQQVGKVGEYQFVPGNDRQQELVRLGHKRVSQLAYENYERLLDEGIAKEVARMTLPVNIYSSMYATCNPRSLMSFLGLRTARPYPDATFPSKPMREIEIVAEQMEAIFATHFPLVHAAFNSNGRVAP